MALYLGNSEKLKIISNNVKCILNINTVINQSNNIRLLSSDGYVLKDLNGLYLLVKEDE